MNLNVFNQSSLYKSLFFTVMLLPTFTGHAQSQLHTKSKKAIAYYVEADNYRVRGHYQQAIDLLDKAIQKDKKFVEAYTRKGLVYRMTNNFDLTEQNYLYAMELYDGTPPTHLFFDLGELYLQKGEYEKSRDYIRKYLIKVSPNSRSYKGAKGMLDNVEFALKSMNEAEPIHIEVLSDTVNQFAMQYFPVLTADQKQLIFTRRLGSGPADDEDLMISYKTKNGSWTYPSSLSENINTELNEGTCTISADGRTLIFTSCHGRQGYGSCDLFISKKSGDNWSVPVNMGPEINSTSWDSQPSLSADGRVLYFVSTRKGGKGKQDIWVSYIADNGKWTKPKNLGGAINTAQNEISPFLHPNGKTLYFSSSGHTGMGGFDIYFSEQEQGKFNEPTNFGYPVNNGSDQVSIFITADGKRAFYSNECGEEARTCSKIFTFLIPESKQVALKSSFITGRILDSLTQKPLASKIDLYDIDKNELVLSVNSDSISGEYLMVLTEGANYSLYVTSKNFLFKSERFEFVEKKNAEPIYKDVRLLPITKNVKTELNNIYFKLDSYELDDKSRTELDVVVRFLQNNPTVKIRIEGHTDNIGSSAYNKELSQKRAQTVFSYLINNNIPKTRLEYIGYGDRFPRYDNNNEEIKVKNRRIEFVVL